MTTRVRAVAVGNRIALPATEEAFVAELERIVSLGAQYLSPKQPNVLVLGEMLGLPAAFAGQRALLARRAATARTAMAEMAAGLLPRMMRCRQMWPGISLPRVAADQWNVGAHVDLAELLPGDLLFWATDPNDPATIHHVAIYIGGGMMIAAPHTGDVVKVEPVYMDGFIGATRPWQQG